MDPVELRRIMNTPDMLGETLLGPEAMEMLNDDDDSSSDQPKSTDRTPARTAR